MSYADYLEGKILDHVFSRGTQIGADAQPVVFITSVSSVV